MFGSRLWAHALWLSRYASLIVFLWLSVHALAVAWVSSRLGTHGLVLSDWDNLMPCSDSHHLLSPDRVVRFPELEVAGAANSDKVETTTMRFFPCYVQPSEPYAWVQPVRIASAWDDPLYICCSSNLAKQVCVCVRACVSRSTPSVLTGRTPMTPMCRH